MRGQGISQAPEPLLGDFSDGISVGVRCVGPDGTILWANAADHQLLGYEASEYVGRNIADFLEEPRAAQDMLAQMRRGERVAGARARLRAKDGTSRHVVVHSSARFDERGELLHTRCFTFDETERVKVVAAGERSDEQLQVALAAGKMGTWEWNIAAERITWSPSLEQLHGIPTGSFAGTFEAYQRDIHPDDRALVLERIRETLSGANHRLEYRILRPDGELRWLEAHGHLMCDAEGRPARLVGVCMDVTERKVAELERARMAEFRQRLLGIVAHDLRSPLGAIAVAADALPLVETLSPRGDAAVDSIRRSAEHMSRMISDLLDYTHGQAAGGIPIAPAPMDMAELGRRLIRDLSPIAAPRALTFASEGDARGVWDEVRVAQVLSNLVHNALHHGEGTVSVLVQAAGDAVVMGVSNGGAPIPPELLPTILQPFARGTRSGHGLGLGLYIVNELARAHGGAVAIESAAESGTHVTVTWPRIAQTREDAP